MCHAGVWQESLEQNRVIWSRSHFFATVSTLVALGERQIPVPHGGLQCCAEELRISGLHDTVPAERPICRVAQSVAEAFLVVVAFMYGGAAGAACQYQA